VTSKTTRAATAARVDIVYRLLLLGLDRQQIMAHVERKYPLWKCAPRTIDSYMKKARELLIEAGAGERPVELGRAAARLHDLFVRAMNEGDRHEALLVVKEIIDLFGLKKQIPVDIAQLRHQLVDLLLEDVLSEADEIARGAAT
jgi:hypothetical protein